MTSNESRARRGGYLRWAVGCAVFAVVTLTAAAFLYGQASGAETTAAERGVVIVEQDALLGLACPLAGSKVARVPGLEEACARKARGEPAVPAAAEVVAGRDGERGVGIEYARQVDRCYVEVKLTDGAVNRYGSFCGQPGPTGPTGPTGTGVPGPSGPTGATGVPGTDGPAGVGVADVRANGCDVDVILTDGTTRTVGPFCGPPVPEYTVNQPDGSAMHCTLDGGSDTAPIYTCEQTEPPTTAPTVTETPTTEPTTEPTTTTETPTALLPTGGLLPPG